MLNLVRPEILDILRRRHFRSIDIIHYLKSQEDGFVPLWNEDKTFDNRSAADRHFEPGNVLVFEEWTVNATEPLGRFVIARCSFVTDRADWGISRGFVALGIKLIAKAATVQRVDNNMGKIFDKVDIYHEGFRVESIKSGTEKNYILNLSNANTSTEVSPSALLEIVDVKQDKFPIAML